MKINISISLLLLLVSFISYGQQDSIPSTSTEEMIHLLKGQILSGYDDSPLEGASVFNLNRVRGTLTDNDGRFQIKTKVNDTIFFSFLGFESFKLKITNDLTKGNELVITLQEENTELEEVVVKSHNLVGVLEIDAKNVPLDKYNRIHINGLPQTYEVGKPKAKNFGSIGAAIFNPIDFLHNKFGKKPKQLRKLKRLKEEEASRQFMESKYQREILLQYLEMNENELEELLKECNFSDYFIRTASDLQVTEAILGCYENYNAVKKGSTQRKDVINKKEE